MKLNDRGQLEPQIGEEFCIDNHLGESILFKTTEITYYPYDPCKGCDLYLLVPSFKPACTQLPCRSHQRSDKRNVAFQIKKKNDTI